MKIAVIGAGAMGGATVEGLLKAGTIPATDIIVADPCKKTLDHFEEAGAHVTPDNQTAAKEADIIMVVVKPWLVENVLKDIKDVIDETKQMLIVIAAGVPSDDIRKWVGTRLPLFLVIPNIAIAQLSSMTFMVPIGANEQQTNIVKGLFDQM